MEKCQQENQYYDYIKLKLVKKGLRFLKTDEKIYSNLN